MKLRGNVGLLVEAAELIQYARGPFGKMYTAEDVAGRILDAVDRALAIPSPGTGTAAVPTRRPLDKAAEWARMSGVDPRDPGPAPEPVKPRASHPLFPDPRTVCKPCDGTGRDTRVPANGWDVACSACNGTGRAPAAEPTPKHYENAQEIRRRAQGPDLTVEDTQAAAGPGKPSWSPDGPATEVTAWSGGVSATAEPGKPATCCDCSRSTATRGGCAALPQRREGGRWTSPPLSSASFIRKRWRERRARANIARVIPSSRPHAATARAIDQPGLPLRVPR